MSPTQETSSPQAPSVQNLLVADVCLPACTFQRKVGNMLRHIGIETLPYFKWIL